MKTKGTNVNLNLPLKIAIVSSLKRQGDIATASFMGETRLSKIVTGREDPTDDEKKAIAKALGKRVHDLFSVSAEAVR